MTTPVLPSKLEELDGFLIESVKDVCSTMLGWQVDAGTASGSVEPTRLELHELNGCIGFGGKMTGSVFWSCSERLALEMARRILGPAVTADGDEISDVAGELTNMLAGGVKSRLCDHDCAVVMSVPNIIRGKFIRATSRDVTFMLQRTFQTPIPGEGMKVVVLGKFD